jgi:CubicO group peptidase (beta-lactamase class C family)
MLRILCLLLAGALGVGAQDLASKIENGLLPPFVVNGVKPVWKIQERMEHYKTPGVSLAVMRGGKIVLAKGYGVLEAGGTARVDEATLFQAASISKPVAALAALHLSQYGNYTLDENVNDKLKSWKVPDNEFTAKQKVTVRELLSHSAGLTVHGFPGYAADAPLPTLVQILNGEKPANTPPIRVNVEPGTLWRYSGGGYTVVQQLMIDRLGKPFPAILQMAVLGPVGMKRSTYEQPLPEDLAANAARAHRSDGSVIAGRWHTYPEMAAAGLWTTPSDLARFAIEIWNAARGASNKVVEKATAAELLTIQKGQYGLGVGIDGEGASLRFAHGGANEGYRCYFVMHRESGNGAVIMANSDRGDALNNEVLRAIAAAEEWPDFKTAAKTAVSLPAAACKSYEGRYPLGGMTVRIACEGGAIVGYVRGDRVEFAAESEKTFFSVDGSAPALRFNALPDGGMELEAGKQKAVREK